MFLKTTLYACSAYALLLAGCAPQSYHTTDQARRVSFAPLDGTVVDGIPLESHILRRTALLMEDPKSDGIHAVKDGLALEFLPRPNTEIATAFAHAVAIEHDGYFLTAKHTLTKPKEIYFLSSTGPEVAIPRIVATLGEPDQDEDFAVIHVDAELPEIFSITRTVIAGEHVAGAGTSDTVVASKHMAVYLPTVFAGTLTSEMPLNGGGRLVSHSAPARPGDSGGPLVNLKGELIGINSKAIRQSPGNGGIAVLPSQEWLHQVIEKDRHTHHEPHQPLPERHIEPNKNKLTLVVSLLNDPRTSGK